MFIYKLIGKQGTRGVAGKKLSPEEIERLKSKLVKPVMTKSKETTSTTASSSSSAAPAKNPFKF